MSSQPKGQCEAVVCPRKEIKGRRIEVKRNNKHTQMHKCAIHHICVRYGNYYISCGINIHKCANERHTTFA